MPTRPTHNSWKEAWNSKTSHSNSNLDPVQYGKQQQPISILLDIPVESLTHVTSYLAPPSLFALSRTCTCLYEHVKDDITWYRAFLTQVVGVGPEDHLKNGKVILLKRLEQTWREEFLLRYRLRQKWEYSRNPTVTHAPQDSTIDDAHLISETGLLTASIQYGVVARSLPLTGKIFKGYLDASGTGLGIGNPNVEFTPDVSACAMSSEGGGTARVFWGKRNGEIAVTTANRVLVADRTTAKLVRCRVEDQHEGMVHKLAVDTLSQTFLSGGADGRVKLWDGNTLRCLWSSDRKMRSLVPDGFVRVAGGLRQGVIVGGLSSGDIYVWTIPHALDMADSFASINLPEFKISSPVQATVNAGPFTSRPELRTMYIQCTSDARISILADYTDHPFFYRISVDFDSAKSEITPFGDISYGYVSVIEPVYASRADESDLVIVGDRLGFVSMYEAFTRIHAEVPAYKFEAHTDGAITAIAWTAAIFATGSAHGTTAVWDSLTLEPLHQFKSPVSRPSLGSDLPFVGKIILEHELILVIVGNCVMACKPGRIKRRDLRTRSAKGKHTNAKNAVSKGYQQYEFRRDISDSFEELEYEREYTRRAMGREREQRLMLDKLGLDEVEAVQYLLMISRDEAESRGRTIDGDGSSVGGEVYEGDFDGLLGTGIGTGTPSSSMPEFAHTTGQWSPHVVPSTSDEKVQVSPPLVLEPMEAGPSIKSSGSSDAIGVDVGVGTYMTARTTLSSSFDDFPAISSSTSSTSNSKGSGNTGSVSRVGSQGSPERARVSAWNSLNTVLSSGVPRGASAGGGGGSRGTLNNTPPLSGGKGNDDSDALNGIEEMEMDAEMKFAIELSLAEAQSRGEVS